MKCKYKYDFNTLIYVSRGYTDSLNISLDNLTSSEKENAFHGFLNHQFDGLNPENIVFLMTMPSPDSAVAVQQSVQSLGNRQPINGQVT